MSSFIRGLNSKEHSGTHRQTYRLIFWEKFLYFIPTRRSKILDCSQWPAAKTGTAKFQKVSSFNGINFIWLWWQNLGLKIVLKKYGPFDVLYHLHANSTTTPMGDAMTDNGTTLYSNEKKKANGVNLPKLKSG